MHFLCYWRCIIPTPACTNGQIGHRTKCVREDFVFHCFTLSVLNRVQLMFELHFLICISLFMHLFIFLHLDISVFRPGNVFSSRLQRPNGWLNGQAWLMALARPGSPDSATAYLNWHTDPGETAGWHRWPLQPRVGSRTPSVLDGRAWKPPVHVFVLSGPTGSQLHDVPRPRSEHGRPQPSNGSDYGWPRANAVTARAVGFATRGCL